MGTTPENPSGGSDATPPSETQTNTEPLDENLNAQPQPGPEVTTANPQQPTMKPEEHLNKFLQTTMKQLHKLTPEGKKNKNKKEEEEEEQAHATNKTSGSGSGSSPGSSSGQNLNQKDMESMLKMAKQFMKLLEERDTTNAPHTLDKQDREQFQKQVLDPAMETLQAESDPARKSEKKDETQHDSDQTNESANEPASDDVTRFKDGVQDAFESSEFQQFAQAQTGMGAEAAANLGSDLGKQAEGLATSLAPLLKMFGKS